jgi:hypothetical protein
MAGAKRRLLFTAAAAALVLAAAGCGGGGSSGTTTTTQAAAATTTSTTKPAKSAPLGKAVYVAKMKVIGRSLSKSVSTASVASTAKTAAAALTKLQKDLRAAAAKLDAITPPAPIAKEHAALTQAVRDFATELNPIITKLKQGSLAARSSLGSLKALQEIQTASSAIAAKGYAIGG